MQILILAGGLGTRLKDIVSDRPKPMALVNDIPFLQYIINNLKRQNLCDIILAVGYMHDKIKDYFNDGKDFGVSIQYAIEDRLLGTGGAIKNAENLYKGNQIMVLNADTYFNINYAEMIKFHNDKNAKLTIALTKTNDAQRYGKVELDDSKKVISFSEKSNVPTSNYVNGGIYIMNHEAISLIEPHKNASFEKEVIPKILKKYDIYGFESNGYFIDIGIPDDYKKFCSDVLRSDI